MHQSRCQCDVSDYKTSMATYTRKVDVRLPGKGNSNSHGARPVHLIITMIKWIRTSRLSIKNSRSGHVLSPPASGGGQLGSQSPKLGAVISLVFASACTSVRQAIYSASHLGGNPGANLKSISRGNRCLLSQLPYKCHQNRVASVGFAHGLPPGWLTRTPLLLPNEEPCASAAQAQRVSTLEVTQRQILSQSPTDANSSR